jgi:eukaryotic-like serine/threonine-protein kinase
MPMDPGRWHRMQALFHRALEVPAAERETLVREWCAGEPDLAAEVLALLAEDEAPGSLLDRGIADAAHRVLDGSGPVPRSVGRYRILGVLGEGGMGVVYLAEREDLDARVALKVLRDASLSPARRERFAREARTLAQFSHPAIARLYDADVLPDGTPYFVMEYVEGVPLTDHCEARRSPVAERLRLFRDACEAVRYAHGRAVIHRDLKPSNILVARGGPSEAASVKLLDFGIAKRLEGLDGAADRTDTGLRLLTPAFAAPEQLRGEPVGVFTDVYALGVILYRLLTGHHPFELAGLSPGQVEARIIQGEPERPSAAARRPGAAGAPPDAPSLRRAEWAELDVLCLTAMHPDPQRRYPSAEALLRDLDHLLRGEPLQARPDTLRYRAGKFLRRNRRPAAAAASAAALLVGLTAFYTVQLREQRNLAQTEARKAAQVSEYLIGLFEAGDPYAPGADNPDARTLLERGERRARELSDQPLVQAAMLDVLGRVHTQLSDFARAEPLLRQALALRRRHGAPLDVAASLAGLGALFTDTGQYDEAEAALREALSLRERHLRAGHRDVAALRRDLGTVLGYQGRYAEAEAVTRLALRDYRAGAPEPDEDLGTTLNGLAVVLYQQGEYTAAEGFYREALEVNQTVFGAEHPSVTRVLANLGKLHEERGSFDTADSLLREALRIRRATLGDEHFETAVGLSQLAGLYSVMGDHARAEGHLREALAIRERILPPDHQSLGTTLNGLALALQHRGEDAEAAALFGRAADIYRASLGPRHRFTGVVLCNLADLRLRMGELDASHARYRECLSILEEVHPENHQELAHNRSRFGALLTARGEYAEAEPLLLRGHLVLREQLGPDHPRTRQAAERLVALYEAWGRPERAAPFRPPPDTGEPGTGG